MKCTRTNGKETLLMLVGQKDTNITCLQNYGILHFTFASSNIFEAGEGGSSE